MASQKFQFINSNLLRSHAFYQNILVKDISTSANCIVMNTLMLMLVLSANVGLSRAFMHSFFGGSTAAWQIRKVLKMGGFGKMMEKEEVYTN